MSRSIKIDQLAAEIAEELKEYSKEVTEDLKEDIKSAGNLCKKEIQANAPEKTGAYKKGWKVKTVYENDSDIRVAVYNPKEYPLAHLLEHGHAKAGGGRVEGKPHIGPAAEKAETVLLKKVRISVKG